MTEQDEAVRRRLNDEYMRGYNAASRMLDSLLAIERTALATPPSAVPVLDVERLARCLQRCYGMKFPTGTRLDFVSDANYITAEYARLTQQEDGDDPQ